MPSEGSKLKIEIFKTLITVAGTIAVSLIGTYFYYKNQPKPFTEKKCTITGSIISADHKPLKHAEIYLIRATGNENMQTTDDQGQFSFDKIPLASYWIVVRDNTSEKSSRVLIESQKNSGEINVLEASLKYKLLKN